MKLIAGLGNPGDGYKDTYHNVGFIALDRLASRFIAPDFRLDKKSNAYLSEQNIYGQKVLLCKPNTYMNLSGDAIGYLVRYYKIDPKDVLVMYDDIDIRKGTVRARPNGSAGTHNGMRDIVAKIGTDFARVRIGTGMKPDFMALADYVLSSIPAFERPIMDGACALACDFTEQWLKGEEWTSLTMTYNA